MTLDEYCNLAEKHATSGDDSLAFDTALDGLLHFEHTDSHSEECYNALFGTMIKSSQKICANTDFVQIVKNEIATAEKKYGIEIALCEDASLEDSARWDVSAENPNKITIKYGTDPAHPYKLLRALVRLVLHRDCIAAGREYEVCCTEQNFANLMGRIRADLEKIVPEDQRQFVDSLGQSICSDLTEFFVSVSGDMMADMKIYAMKEFRPLQLNAMGRELRSYVKIANLQNGKAQKSETVTEWFRTLLMLPAHFFRSQYSVNLVGMFESAENTAIKAGAMYSIFENAWREFSAGDEYKVMKLFLNELGLGECVTIRPKFPKANGGTKPANGPIVN